jgi:hypothetical protein
MPLKAGPSGSPAPDEAAAYYSRYIEHVSGGDVVGFLEAQRDETLLFLRRVSEQKSRERYAPDKWNVREVLSHVNDTERVMSFRAFWFARGFTSPLPSFDQELSAEAARASRRAWSDHVLEFAAVRAATLAFFQSLSSEDWLRRGVASDNPFTVRALAYVTAGHLAHHVSLLRERYACA